jgi:site-specific DNA-methyltransferase (adenine-specific)
MADMFDNLLPPLSTEEFSALKADIREHGILSPVFVDEDGNVLDGKHRLAVDPNAPRKVIRGLTPAEKEAFVFRCNFVRRNLSPDQKAEARRKMKVTASKLRAENPRKWTLKKIGDALGVHLDTVSGWFATNSEFRNGCRLDARLKVPTKLREQVAERAQNGATHEQIAADIGVSRQAVTKIVNLENRKTEARREREEIAKQIQGDCDIRQGDFAEILPTLPENSVDLILTDPPYDKESISTIYGVLAQHAARVLKPGASLITYAGHDDADFIMQMKPHLRFWWTICVKHSGPSASLDAKCVFAEWKPLLWFVKGQRRDRQYVRDYIQSEFDGKDFHEWQQGKAEALYLIERLTIPGEMVLDPMCGSGTTLVAAKELGRRWLGIDIDPGHVETARFRLTREDAA